MRRDVGAALRLPKLDATATLTLALRTHADPDEACDELWRGLWSERPPHEPKRERPLPILGKRVYAARLALDDNHDFLVTLAAPSADDEELTRCAAEACRMGLEEEACRAAWAARGECAANPSFMRARCRVACGAPCDAGAIVDDPACADGHEMCPSWALTGDCEQNDGLHATCPVSCRKCATRACHDALGAAACAARARDDGCFRDAATRRSPVIRHTSEKATPWLPCQRS